MNLPGGWELILVLLVATMLFGSKRLPGAARSLGQSLRVFKAETRGLRDDGDAGAAGVTGPPSEELLPAQPTMRPNTQTADCCGAQSVAGR